MAEFRRWLSESNHEENRRIIHAAFQRGVDKRDASVLGYHGTSLQTIRAATERGFLPVTKGSEDVYGSDRYGPGKEPYGLHIVPNPNNPTVRGIKFRRASGIDPLEDAANWAKNTRNRHHLFDKHGLDMDDIEHHRAAFLVQQGEMPEKSLAGLGRPPRTDIVRGAVVISISDDVARDFRVGPGGDGDDLNIQTRHLPINYIRGIEPHDQESYDWLQALGGAGS